jgi:hypothetical protein
MSPIVTSLGGLSIYSFGFGRGGASVYYALNFKHSTAIGYGGWLDLNSSGILSCMVNTSTTSNYLQIDGAGTLGSMYGWTTNYGTLTYSVKNDSTGNLVFVGTIPTGQINAEVVKATKTGSKTWSRTYTPAGTNSSEGGRLDLDASDNIYLVTKREYNLSGGRWQVIKYNSAGTIQWQKDILGSTWNDGWDIAASDSDGSVITTGSISNSSRPTIFKLNTSGTLVWQLANMTGGNYHAIPAIDSSNNVYIGRSLSAGAAIEKFNSAGTWQWGRTFAPLTSGQMGMAVDSTGNTYLGTYTASSIVIAKYNSAGTIQWQRQMTSSSGSLTTSEGWANISANGDSIAFSCYDGGNNSGLVFKLPADGSKLGTYACGTYSYTWAASSAVDAALTNSWSDPGMSVTNATGTDAAGSLSLSASSGFTNTKKVIP